MAVSAHDVARELRRRQPDVGDLKVHKLLYYCQGWHATFTRKRLFHEPIEAWTHGPVVVELWLADRMRRVVPGPTALDEQASQVIGYVLAGSPASS